MTEPRPFAVQTIHARVARYLKRQEKRIQRQFWEALEHLCAGPFPVDDPTHIAHLKGPYHTRILEYAKWEDIWRYLTLADVRRNFDRLSFRRDQDRELWAYALDRWARSAS